MVLSQHPHYSTILLDAPIRDHRPSPIATILAISMNSTTARKITRIVTIPPLVALFQPALLCNTSFFPQTDLGVVHAEIIHKLHRMGISSNYCIASPSSHNHRRIYNVSASSPLLLFPLRQAQRRQRILLEMPRHELADNARHPFDGDWPIRFQLPVSQVFSVQCDEQVMV